MDTKKPTLSIIFPAHNEERRLPETFALTDAFIKSQSFPIEVVIVENGSSDRTLDVAREYAATREYVTVLHEKQAGKGLAVQKGMLAAKGNYRFICDVDLSMPLSEIPRFIPPQLENVDIAIASREARGAVRYNEPEYRHLTGRVFNTLVRWLAVPGFQDTQCGFKCFSGRCAEELFLLQTIGGWTFDVEILAIALKKGFKIIEIPIPWYYQSNSKVKVLRDSFQMARDLIMIRKNLRNNFYDRTH